LVGSVSMSPREPRKEALQKVLDKSSVRGSLRLVIDSIPTLVWRAGPDESPISSINSPRLHGLSREPGPETAWPRAFHPDDKKHVGEVAAIWESACQAGLKPGSGASMVNIAGSCSSRPLRDESGNIVKWYGLPPTSKDRNGPRRPFARASSAS